MDPVRYFLVSYSILLAAVTFQSLRFLNQLAIELNTTHVEHEVMQRNQHPVQWVRRLRQRHTLQME